MPITNLSVTSLPDNEVVVRGGLYLFNYIIRDAERYLPHFQMIKLEGNDSCRAKFNEVIDTFDPVFITGNGHGLTGHGFYGQTDDLFYVCDNNERLAGRVAYLISCSTCNFLGPDSMTKGCTSYQAWAVLMGYCTRGGQEPTDWGDDPFYRTSAFTLGIIPMILARGGTTGTASKFYQLFSDFWIDLLERSKEWWTSTYLLARLLTQREGFCHLGNTTARVADISHVPMVHVFRPVDVGISQEIPINIAVACAQECNLTGGIVQVINSEGVVIKEVGLGIYIDGANFTGEFTINAPNTVGAHHYTVKFLGLGEHPPYEDKFLVYCGSERAYLIGKFTPTPNIEFSDVFVQGINTGYTANAWLITNGEYEFSLPLDTYIVIGRPSKASRETKRVSVEALNQYYVLNFTTYEAGAPPIPSPVIIEVHIYNEFLNLIEGATVTINGTTLTTNDKGFCLMNGLSIGIHTLTIEKEGKTVTKTVICPESEKNYAVPILLEGVMGYGKARIKLHARWGE